LGGSNMMPGGSVNPTAGESIQVTENLRRGFTGLALRPNAYEWRYQGEREVIAPINVTRGGYPQEKERNFGPSGLSIGNDRWDVRHAVILQGSLKERGQEYDLVTLWIDYQTAQPLYIVTRRRMAQQMVEVGIWSRATAATCPRIPPGRAARRHASSTPSPPCSTTPPKAAAAGAARASTSNPSRRTNPSSAGSRHRDFWIGGTSAGAHLRIRLRPSSAIAIAPVPSNSTSPGSGTKCTRTRENCPHR